MYSKFIFRIVVVSVIVTGGAAYFAYAAKPVVNPAPVTQSKATPATKPVEKSTKSEDEKYAEVYEKCTKEAEGKEARYDQVFNTCMEKNGFPQEEYDTGGQSVSGGED